MFNAIPIKALMVGTLVHLSLLTTQNSFRMNDVVFEKNSSELSDEQVNELKKEVAEIIRIEKSAFKTQITIWIDGNSDASESDPKKLSRQRAEVVKQKLLALGLSKKYLITHGFGTEKPLTEPGGTSSWKNARVTFRLRL